MSFLKKVVGCIWHEQNCSTLFNRDKGWLSQSAAEVPPDLTYSLRIPRCPSCHLCTSVWPASPSRGTRPLLWWEDGTGNMAGVLSCFITSGMVTECIRLGRFSEHSANFKLLRMRKWHYKSAWLKEIVYLGENGTRGRHVGKYQELSRIHGVLLWDEFLFTALLV